jgi:cytochrome P450
MTIPSHVPRDRVVDFDFANVPGAGEDVHLAWKRLHDGPPIFWTPRYGGHWVATRADAIEAIQKDHEVFSHREFSLPRGYKPFPLLPLEADPPLHADYRKIIAPGFSPVVVAKLEQKARALAIELIEGFRSRGNCEFMNDFARHLPVIVFLGMMDLPLDDREKLQRWGEVMVRTADKEEKHQVFQDSIAYLSRFIDERSAQPGADLISRVVQSQANGNPLRRDEVLGMCALLFFGGLDTVASMLGFFARFLARNPGHRRQLVENPALIPQAIEELLRRHGLSNTMRVVTRDVEFHGVTLHTDEMIMVPISLHGLDEQRFANPLEVDFARKPLHATFGNGPHKCPGANLARTELRIFLEEWLPRIPDFEVAPDDVETTATGSVNGILYLPLVWQV